MCASHCMHGNYFYDNSVNILHVALLSTISIAIASLMAKTPLVKATTSQ